MTAKLFECQMCHSRYCAPKQLWKFVFINQTHYFCFVPFFRIMWTSKLSIAAAIAFLLSSAVASANGPVFLFDHLVPGTFLTNESTVARTEVNIDINDGVVYYVDGEYLMELANVAELDTLYAEGRKFVIRNDRVCEVLPKEYGEILVNWKRTDPESSANENTYCLRFEGQEYELGKVADLYAQFPHKASDIKRFVRSYGLTMKTVRESEKIFDYICTGALPVFTDNDLLGHWCLDMDYNKTPHRVIHFIDGERAVVYMETSSANRFHGIPGLEIPGFSGLFYCPQDNTEFSYTVKDGIVRIANGMTFEITKKGLLKDVGGIVFKKLEQRHFAEVIPPVNANYANPEASSPIPIGGLIVAPEGYR